MAQWHSGTVAQWHGGTVALWHSGAVPTVSRASHFRPGFETYAVASNLGHDRSLLQFTPPYEQIPGGHEQYSQIL